MPAHLTLFHKLPGEQEAVIRAVLAESCADTPPLPLEVTGLFSLGRGVAYRLRGEALTALRARLAQTFADWLTPQDRQGFRPHVTVQNKADPAEARVLLERLQAVFEPFTITGEGLLLWRYLGGPWELAADVPFSG